LSNHICSSMELNGGIVAVDSAQLHLGLSLAYAQSATCLSVCKFGPGRYQK
jgi:hypothetical protein